MEKKTTQGIYIGKGLGKSGQKKDGTPYRQWKLSFKPFENSPKSFNITLFQSPDQTGTWLPEYNMQEGNWYTLEYIEKDYIGQHGPAKSKTLSSVMAGQHAQKMTGQQYQSTPQQQQPLKKIAKDWVQFAQEYDETFKENQAVKTPLHMLTLYILNRHKEEFADIIALCKKHFEYAKTGQQQQTSPLQNEEEGDIGPDEMNM